VAIAIVKIPSVGRRSSRPGTRISLPASYGTAIAQTLPAGFDVVAVVRRASGLSAKLGAWEQTAAAVAPVRPEHADRAR